MTEHLFPPVAAPGRVMADLGAAVEALRVGDHDGAERILLADDECPDGRAQYARLGSVAGVVVMSLSERFVERAHAGCGPDCDGVATVQVGLDADAPAGMHEALTVIMSWVEIHQEHGEMGLAGAVMAVLDTDREQVWGAIQVGVGLLAETSPGGFGAMSN